MAQLLRMTGFALACILQAPLHCRRAHPSPKHDIISFHYMNPISKTDFRNQGEVSLLKTATQTTPSTSIFVDDIGYQGTSNATTVGGNAAFFVATDNVVIDLGGKTLYQNSPNTGTNGIEINTSQKNITIKNGSIVGFKGAGIYVRSGCDNIRIQNVVISSCGKQGIYFAGTAVDGTDVSNCIIENTIVSRSTGIATVAPAVGLQLDYCQNIFINNSIFSHSDGRAATMDGIGALINSSINVVFNKCDASAQKGQDAYGFKITGTTVLSSACAFLQCTAQNNIGTNTTGGTGYGFYASIVNSCLWKNCIAAANSGTRNGYGFYTSVGQYTAHNGCEANFNKAGSLATLATDGGRGFFTTNGIGNNYTDCVAIGNQGNPANAANLGIGFDLQTESYCLMSNCEARAQGTDSSAAWAIGMNLNNCSQSLIKKSKLINNRSNSAGQAYGIRDTATASTTLITDSFFFGNGQGATCTNFSITYPGQGELNSTASASVGGMGGITIIRPFQNVTVTPS